MIAVKQYALSAVLLGLACVFVFAFSWGTLPNIMQDEYVYSIGSRYKSGYPDEFGNHLYFFLFGATSFFGGDFYSANKFLNAVMLFIGSVGVLQIGLRFYNWRISLLFALSFVLGPSGLYVSVFMPEVLFAAIAVWLVYCFTRFLDSEDGNRWFYYVLMIILSAGLILVKPHAVALIAGFSTTMLLSSLLAQRLRAGLRIVAVGYLLFTYFVWILTGSILTGEFRLFPFGNTYMSAASAWVGDGILFILVIITFGLGVAVFFLPMLAQKLSKLGSWKSGTKHEFLRLVIVLLVFLSVMTVLFSLLVTDLGDNHSDRLLLRYVEFMFPLLLMAVLGVSAQRSSARNKIILIVLVGAFFVFFLRFALAEPALADSAYIFSLSVWGFIPAFIGIVLVIVNSLSGKPVKSELSPKLVAVAVSFCLMLPTTMALTSRALTSTAAVSSDIAGQAVHALRDKNIFETAYVVGANRQQAFNAMFWIDMPESQYLQSLTLLDLEQLTAQGDLVLVLDPIEGLQGDISGDGYAIFTPSR